MHINRHHIFFPARWYRSPLEKKFRNLECNVVVLQVEVHNLIHQYQEPPTKPTEIEMARAIRHHEARRCPCFITHDRHERRKSA